MIFFHYNKKIHRENLPFFMLKSFQRRKFLEKLNFLTAGVPIAAKNYDKACDILRSLNLDGMELEFVHGVRMGEDNQKIMKEKKGDLVFTAHAPFYINLNSREEEKVAASIERIIETARMTKSLGGYSIVYHAGFYLGMTSEDTSLKIKKCHEKIFEVLDDEKNDIWLRAETTGKGSQWGNIDEIIELSKEFEHVLPCVDFSHIHARENGAFNTYDEFCSIFEKIGKNLGDIALNNFHAHIAGIAYGAKGEKHHLNLEESDMNYKDLLRAFKTFDIKGVIICESPNIEDDCVILKEYYNSL